MKVLCIFVSLVMSIQAGYHEDVGIPLAAKIKEYEDKLLAKDPEMASRVVGGEIAPVFAHPYLVGMILRTVNDFVSMCGSSLVTASRLVTAAHCLDNIKSLKAVIGSPYLYHGGERIVTTAFTKHPRYDESVSLDYDIGIVKLPKEIEITETVHPIRLPSTPNDAEVIGEWAVAAGWGLTKDADRGKQKGIDLVLNQVRLQIAPEVVCIEEHKSYGNVTYMALGNSVCTSGAGGVGVCNGDSGGPLVVERNGKKILISPDILCEMEYHSFHVPANAVCTKGAGGVGTCDGDSGGPLVVERNGTKVLIGIISHGHIPCQGSYPSVFTRVQTYKDFILRN